MTRARALADLKKWLKRLGWVVVSSNEEIKTKEDNCWVIDPPYDDKHMKVIIGKTNENL